jgi:FtsZ-binding cell division protein ZapB
VEQPQAAPAPPDDPFTLDMAMEQIGILIAKVEELQNANNELAAANYSLEDHQIPALRTEISSLYSQIDKHLEKIESVRGERNRAENRTAILSTYTHFATFPLEDETLGTLEEASRKLKHAMLTDGLTNHEAIELLRRQLEIIPEANILGGFTDFIVNHLSHSRSAEFAIKKQMLENHQKRMAEYLVAMGCFNCPCGRNLDGYVNANATSLYTLCPRCLIQPYCNTVCAGKSQPLHALMCNTHKGWSQDDHQLLNFFSMVPLITRATLAPRIQAPFPPALTPQVNTTMDLHGNERYASKTAGNAFQLNTQGWERIKNLSSNIQKWTHKATGKTEWTPDETIRRGTYMNIQNPLEHVDHHHILVTYLHRSRIREARREDEGCAHRTARICTTVQTQAGQCERGEETERCRPQASLQTNPQDAQQSSCARTELHRAG